VREIYKLVKAREADGLDRGTMLAEIATWAKRGHPGLASSTHYLPRESKIEVMFDGATVRFLHDGTTWHLA
jgi:hypothetical protein